MTILHRNRFAELPDLRREMERWFGAPELGLRTPVFPPLNAWEHESTLTVEAEFPGFAMDNLDISLTGRDLTIRGRHEEQAPEGATVHRRERPVGEFARTIRLPFEVDADNVEASLRDGVLTVRLPRSKADLPRKIRVVAE